VIRTARLVPKTRAGSGSVRRALGVVGTASMVVSVAVLVVLAVWPELLTRTDPLTGSADILDPPSWEHLFGTDQLGRDIYARVIQGAHPVLVAAVGGVAMAATAGIALGLAAGVGPRWFNGVIMRVVDVLLALPTLLIALIMIAVLGSGVSSIAFALGIAYTPSFARIVEASIRRLRTIEFVHAARLFGSSAPRTAIQHLLPNLSTEVVVMASSALGWSVLTATTLSFLNFGVQLPNPDWGADLAAGATSLSTSWWLSIFPGLAITFTILIANFVGDRLVVVLDPRRTRRRKMFRPIFRTTSGSASADVPAATNHTSTSVPAIKETTP
jgi:peptide/nickel transport system permease protein